MSPSLLEASAVYLTADALADVSPVLPGASTVVMSHKCFFPNSKSLNNVRLVEQCDYQSTNEFGIETKTTSGWHAQTEQEHIALVHNKILYSEDFLKRTGQSPNYA